MNKTQQGTIFLPTTNCYKKIRKFYPRHENYNGQFIYRTCVVLSVSEYSFCTISARHIALFFSHDTPQVHHDRTENGDVKLKHLAELNAQNPVLQQVYYMPLRVSSTMCSSSGGQNCIIQHLVSSHL